MKYWTGYLTAAVIAAITWALQQTGAKFTQLVDMVYPYVSRTLMDVLATWSSGVDDCLWQIAVIAFAAVVVVSLAIVIIMRWNAFRWAGWLLAVCSFVYLLNTAVFGLNYHAGPIADDIRMEVRLYTVDELADAAEYYRDKANDLAELVARDANGEVDFDEFADLALLAENGFDHLVYDRKFPIFSGCTLPVKELGWANMYSAMGITGFTLGLTGEAAVNPQIPDVSLPFTMCHEMAHRMSIATEGDANFAAFLACQANDDVQYRYSAYFMAYRYCYNALVSSTTPGGAAAAARVVTGASDLLKRDMSSYGAFFSSRRDEKATEFADTVNDTYLKTSGDEAGVASYGDVVDLLVSWHYQEIVLPVITEEQEPFDPFDENQVDLSENANARTEEEG